MIMYAYMCPLIIITMLHQELLIEIINSWLH